MKEAERNERGGLLSEDTEWCRKPRLIRALALRIACDFQGAHEDLIPALRECRTVGKRAKVESAISTVRNCRFQQASPFSKGKIKTDGMAKNSQVSSELRT